MFVLYVKMKIERFVVEFVYVYLTIVRSCIRLLTSSLLLGKFV